MTKASLRQAEKLHVGWRERVSLADLGLVEINAKIDTGARTTALHASNIRRFERDGAPWVEFLSDHGRTGQTDLCTAPVHHLRKITNTSGKPEQRFIIATPLQIGARTQLVEVSLADRTEMSYPIIIGRTALRQLRLLVDPSRSWLMPPDKTRNP